MLARIMRLLLRLVCGFTILAAAWLTTMYFVLKHPGYQAHAMVSASFVAASLVTIAFLQLARPPGWLQALVAATAIGLGYAGATTVSAVLKPDAHFEGYALVIGAMLVVQAALTLVVIASPSRQRTTHATP